MSHSDVPRRKAGLIAPVLDSFAALRRSPAPPVRRVALALGYALVCHSLFAVGVGAMIAAMYFGMSRSLGDLPGVWAVLANAALIAQFALGHSFFLSARGRALLRRLAPADVAEDLLPTTYAAVASVQVLLLFALWTPSGVVVFEAEGALFWTMTTAYALSWALLGKAMLDAGLGLQSGVIGWFALLEQKRPRYPGLPTAGLFRFIRQPIYAAFALTLWTPPVWTPDQLAVAVGLTAYCLLGPLAKERRFAKIYGEAFERYRAETPYFLPRLSPFRRAERAAPRRPKSGASRHGD